MRVLGIDASTKTGLVCIDELGVYTSVLENKALRGYARTQWIGRQFENYLNHHAAIDCAVIEGYGYANKYTLVMMVEIGFYLRHLLREVGIPCYICPPTVLKKYVGAGNAKKPEVALAVKAKWGYENPNDDVIDAYVLARIAQQVASGTHITGVELLT